MAEVLSHSLQRAAESDVVTRLELQPSRYVVATIHRAENTISKERLAGILEGLSKSPFPVIFPVHPRTRHAVESWKIDFPPNIRVVEPLGYLDMVQLTRSAWAIVTDSGGVQKEAYWLGVPCLTARDETEWVETVECGWNTLIGADPTRIAAALHDVRRPAERPPLYGDDQASVRCLRLLEQA